MRSARHIRVPRAACKILATSAAKSFAVAIAAVLLLPVCALPARAAQEPVYDTFAKMLAPFSSAIFGGGAGQPGALVAECLVKSGTGSLAAAQGVHFRIAIQAPDRIRVDVVRDNIRLTACRDERALWAAPEALMRALAEAAGLDLSKTAPDAAPVPLLPVALDPQMLAFLPVIFDVKDLGSEDAPPLRILEFALLRELREALKVEGFTGRAWISDDHKPSRLLFSTPQGSLDIAVEKLEFAESLPSGAWQPDEGAASLHLPASSLSSLFEKMLGTRLPANAP